jgi:alkaline phosphatase D
LQLKIKTAKKYVKKQKEKFWKFFKMLKIFLAIILFTFVSCSTNNFQNIDEELNDAVNIENYDQNDVEEDDSDKSVSRDNDSNDKENYDDTCDGDVSEEEVSVNDDDTFEADNFVTEKCGIRSGYYDNAVPLDQDPLQIPADSSVFPLPVQAGSMTQTSAIISVYSESIPRAGAIVWRDGDGVSGPLYVFHDEITPRENGLLKVFVENLAPDTMYRYTFFEIDASGKISSRSLAGSFRTAFPDNCKAVLTISGTHGTNYKKYDEFTAVKKSAAFEIDFWVQLGDFSYNDGAVTREEFLDKWYATLSDEGWFELLPSTGQYIVWDDHEVIDDSVLYLKMESDPEMIETGQKVFFDLLPVPEISATGVSGKYWNSFKWGETAEIFTIDVRSERIYEFDSNNERKKCIRYLSKEQLDWLKEGLSESNAHFKIILNSVPIVEMPSVWPMSIDRWDCSPQTRKELLDFILTNNIENVWFLSGDFHTGSVARISPEGGAYSTIYEINLGPGGNTFPYPYLGQLGQFVIAPKNQFSFFRTFPNVTVITFDPFENSVSVDFYHPESDTLLHSETLY